MVSIQTTLRRALRGTRPLPIGLVLLSLGCSDPPPDDSDASASGGSGASPSSSGGTAAGGSSSGGTPNGTTGGTAEVEGWTLVWADEFEGSGLPDESNWTIEDRAPGWVNAEQQRYSGPRAENLRVENGSLIIEARRDYYLDDEYSSARIHSRGKASFLYGRFEIRAKLPKGRGTWPALWMMPENIFHYATTCTTETGWIDGCNAWPDSGEIDIMEHVGYEPNVVHFNTHTALWHGGDSSGESVVLDDVFDTFHLYQAEWDPEKIVGLVDGVPYMTYENLGQGYETWPFDQAFHFIFNIAVGGTWGGAQGVDPDAFPTRMEIDYVRAYEKDSPE